jgi:hypothetical protein
VTIDWLTVAGEQPGLAIRLRFFSIVYRRRRDFTMDVPRRYGHPNLDLLKTKLEFFATADFVDLILHGDGRAQERQQDLAWSRLRER